ncbi:MAG: hypothetical protein WD716_05705 [Fimbriimonadaceae bacterium]
MKRSRLPTVAFWMGAVGLLVGVFAPVYIATREQKDYQFLSFAQIQWAIIGLVGGLVLGVLVGLLFRRQA